MADFRRRKVEDRGFVGYRFSRLKRSSAAGFAYGFALEPDAVPGVRKPPEAVAYVFVRPVDSALYKELVLRRGSPVRRLVAESRSLGYPFELYGGKEIAAVRHRPLGRMPQELFVLTAADFFMITQSPLRVGGFLEAVRAATTRPGP